MLIVSKFHDYYDSAIGYGGVDKSCVYNRKFIKMKNVNPFEGYFPKVLSSSKNEVTCTFFIVGFCGILYVGARFANTEAPLVKNKFKPYCLYDEDAIKEAMKKHGLKERKYFYLMRTNIASLFNEFHKKPEFDLFFKYKVPIFSFSSELKLNPNLKRLQFYKVFDSYNAFQELYMFLSGVFGNAEKTPIKISDTDRLVAKGFDKKTSFRKERKHK